MKRLILCASAIIVLFLFCLPVFADTGPETVDNAKSPWFGDVEAGYQMTTGNTETRSLNGQMSIGYDSGDWHHEAGFRTVYSHEKEDGTTTQRFLATGKTKYGFNENDSLYGLSIYENDRFSAYNYRVTLSAGYHRQILFTDRLEWSAEIGPGYRYSNYREDGISSDDEAIAHVGTVFLYRFTQRTSFREEISVDAGDENTAIRSVSSLRISLSEQLSLRLTHIIRHVTGVPDDTKKTDTETFFSLGYVFP